MKQQHVSSAVEAATGFRMGSSRGKDDADTAKQGSDTGQHLQHGVRS
jgi:hypothetical protein